MANILDYVFWRGDLDFKRCEFNEVDALILSTLSYSRFYNLLTPEFDKKVYQTFFSGRELNCH